ncbi:MAG TPA: flagellar biosynthesis protein FlhB [Clostridia bacterium]|nr:flagellar biosynthesis protein FlhB [Clostridia bacterium]
MSETRKDFCSTNSIIKFDLQLFAEEKTEKATPKRRQDARKKGQVAKSTEINSALILVATFSTIFALLPDSVGKVKELLVSYLSLPAMGELTIEYIHNLTVNLVLFVVRITIPIMLTAALVGIAANLGQIGFLIPEQALSIKLERINPIEGFKRIFSKRSLVELAKAILKIILISCIAYSSIKKSFNWFIASSTLSPIVAANTLAELARKLVLQLGGGLIILAAADYMYQRWEFEKAIRMSKQEIKEEYKQTEGDPQIKAKIKEMQRQIARRRMMQEVPKADVIITNPTHYAVAIQYDEQTMEAPKIIAKGQDFIAEQIKKIAQQHGIPMVENKPLAQTLYKTVEIGDYIPPKLYQAVAEVLAFVYRFKGKV